MMSPLTINDLRLVNNLSSRQYTRNQLSSKASSDEINQFNDIRKKLKRYADFFAEKYSKDYGPFEVSVATGNPIAIGGIKLKRVWSGIFKGATNKQYALQISFVIDINEPCLNVGFYFGRASGHSLSRKQRFQNEEILNGLSIDISNAIKKNKNHYSKYNALFDLPFKAYTNGISISPDEWLSSILTLKNAKKSEIIVQIKPNSFNIIEDSTVDFYVSQIIFLLGIISEDTKSSTKKLVSPEQMAKKAEQLAKIGLDGELFILAQEKEKLNKLGIKTSQYPYHIALDSVTSGYDILSLDENNNEILIEVKSTTRAKNDKNSKSFFISHNEYDTYLKNKSRYKLYRVYDVENNPSSDIINLEDTSKEPDGFIIKY